MQIHDTTRLGSVALGKSPVPRLRIAAIQRRRAVHDKSPRSAGYTGLIPHQAAKPRTDSVVRTSSRARTRMVSCTIGWYRV